MPRGGRPDHLSEHRHRHIFTTMSDPTIKSEGIVLDDKSNKSQSQDESNESGAAPRVEDETSQNSSILVKTPSFAGQLDLSGFAYGSQLLEAVPAETAAARRSPRLSSSAKRATSLRSPRDRDNEDGSADVRSRGATPRSSPLKRSSSSTASLSPSKKSRSRIPPATASAYAHLPFLDDRITSNLLVLFVGLNPGIATAVAGHAYAHPSNLFWKLLHSSGITYRRHPPSDDVHLPRLYGLGNTNIVERPTRNGAELTKAEMDASVAALQEKVRRWKPEVVTIVGKSIWESIWRVTYGRGIKKDEFKYGWQDDHIRMGEDSACDQTWKGAKVFVACSTSGLAATLRPAEKEVIWNQLGEWVQRRRRELGIKEGEDFVKSEDYMKLKTTMKLEPPS